LTEREAVAKKRLEWLHSEWQSQRETIAEIRSLLAREEEMRTHEEKARHAGDLGRAGHIAYKELPKLSLKIEELERKLESVSGEDMLMRDCVQVEDVVAIAAQWTGLSPDELAQE
jgi:hypothetical protein